jgi:hypothetical protein
MENRRFLHVEPLSEQRGNFISNIILNFFDDVLNLSGS